MLNANNNRKFYIDIYSYSSQIYTYIYTVANISSGSNKFIKVILRQERVLAFRTTSMKGFDPLQMLTTVYIYIYIIYIYIYVCVCVCVCVCVWFMRSQICIMTWV